MIPNGLEDCKQILQVLHIDFIFEVVITKDEAQPLLNRSTMKVWSMYGKSGAMPIGSRKRTKEK